MLHVSNESLKHFVALIVVLHQSENKNLLESRFKRVYSQSSDHILLLFASWLAVDFLLSLRQTDQIPVLLQSLELSRVSVSLCHVSMKNRRIAHIVKPLHLHLCFDFLIKNVSVFEAKGFH